MSKRWTKRLLQKEIMFERKRFQIIPLNQAQQKVVGQIQGAVDGATGAVDAQLQGATQTVDATVKGATKAVTGAVDAQLQGASQAVDATIKLVKSSRVPSTDNFRAHHKPWTLQ